MTRTAPTRRLVRQPSEPVILSTGAPVEHPVARTIVDLFLDDVRSGADRPALRWRGPDGWQSHTWGEYGEAVWDLANVLIALGVEPGDRVAIASANRPEWHIADVATIASGAVSVPLYPTSTSSQMSYVLGHSGARACFVDTPAQLAKVLLRAGELEHLQHVVVMDDVGGLDGGFVTTWDAARTRGAAIREQDGSRHVDERLAGIDAGDLLTIVYTSGTTGPPKGVMLSHGNVIETIRSLTQVVSIGPDDRFFSFLPLSHIAERTVSHFGQIVSGGETWFARSLQTVAEDLPECRPTVFFAVPRLWEKFRDGITAQVAGQPRPLQEAFERLVETGLQVVAHQQDGTPLPLADRLTHLALDQTLGRALRHRVGLDQAHILVSAAAPIHPDLLRWLHAIGLPVAEVYGQTEDCGPSTINPPDRIRIGTVGPPIPGGEVRIAPDGEILVRGPNVGLGYYRNPEGTAELLDEEGWMHSGDLGALDPDGYLRITGRKKDLIVNAAGKNIAPQPIELELQAAPVIAQAVVVGDGRPYLTALLTVDADEVASWPGKEHLRDDAVGRASDPEVLAATEHAVDAVNATRSPVEQIKRWRLLPEDLTVDEGELTPTLKVRRAAVVARWSDLVEEIYAAAR